MDNIIENFKIRSDVFLFDKNMPTSNKFSLENLNIMIVDDDVRDIKLLETLLQNDHRITFNLSKWTSANQAISYLQNDMIQNNEEPPHIMLLDLMMPEMNGKEVLKKLKEVSTTQGLTIAIHSSMSNCENVIQVAQLGSVAFFQKPLDVPLFIDFIAKHA